MATDKFVIRCVVVFLGLIVLLGMGIGGYLAIDGKNVPDFIISVTSGAIGALSALLAKTGSETQVMVPTSPQPLVLSDPEAAGDH